MTNLEDLPGVLKARGALTALSALAQRGGARTGRVGVRQYVNALYTEIREARVQGCSFSDIAQEIRKIGDCPAMAPGYLAKMFAEIDDGWAKETGVPALPRRKVHSKKGGAK